MSSDRYEGKRGRGHSFGATYSGVTSKNRPVLDAFPTEWTEEFAVFSALKVKLPMSGFSIAACMRSLRRHGLIEARAVRTGPHGEWLGVELRRREGA